MQNLNTIENINLSFLKGILIDIDDTLYSYKHPHESAVRECFNQFIDQFSISITYEDFFFAYTESRLKIKESLEPQGSCRSRLFAFDALFRKYNIEFTYHHAYLYENIYWNTFFFKMKVCERAFNFLQECKQKKVIVCAVTDMQAHIQVKKLETLKITDYINYLASSEEAGAEKPNEKIFNLALKKMKLQKDEVVMIGDSLAKDIKGAENFGIKAIHFKA